MTGFRQALAALDAAGVPHCVRNGGQDVDALAPAADLDVLVARRHLGDAGRALRSAGLHRLAAPGHRGHVFYVTYDGGDWRKVDLCSLLRYGATEVPVEPLIERRRRVDGVWVTSAEDDEAHRARRRAGLREPRTLARRLLRKRPAGLRRRGPVVAVLGPDGAGKGSTLDGCAARLPIAVTRVYLGNQRPSRPAGPSGTGVSSTAVTAVSAVPATPAPSWARESVFLVRKVLPVWRRVAVAYAASWRGHLVLCDRHPVEVLAIRPPRTPLGAALERLLFVRLVPAPDHVVVLDAPGEVLWRRKGEHDPELLERWRQAYLATFVPPGTVVSTTGPVQGSVDALLGVLWGTMCRRNDWPSAQERTG